jgi:hypothetical protein
MVSVVYCLADVQVSYFVIFNFDRSTAFSRILALICGIWNKPVGKRHVRPSVSPATYFISENSMAHSYEI